MKKFFAILAVLSLTTLALAGCLEPVADDDATEEAAEDVVAPEEPAMEDAEMEEPAAEDAMEEEEAPME